MTTSVQDWAAGVAETPPGAGGWADDSEQREEFIDRIQELSLAEVQLSARQLDRILRHAAIEGGEILAGGQTQAHRQREFLRSLASLVIKVDRQEASRPSAVQTIWETMLEIAELNLAQEIRETVFDVLSAQLRHSSRSLQVGALLGLNQLGDPRTKGIIRGAWTTFASDDVRDQAAAMVADTE